MTYAALGIVLALACVALGTRSRFRARTAVLIAAVMVAAQFALLSAK
jgi:sulfite exporter TauE/SafE